MTYSWTFGDGGTSTQPRIRRTRTRHPGSTPPGSRCPTVRNSTCSRTMSRSGSAILRRRRSLRPTSGSLFRAGDVDRLSRADATDAEDGTLPASAFSWTILFHHESHVHPSGGPFTEYEDRNAPDPDERARLPGLDQLRDRSDGDRLDGSSATSTSVTVVPDKVNLSFDTVPIRSDRRNRRDHEAAPVRARRAQGLPAHDQCAGPVERRDSYTFASWSDGGAQSHGDRRPDATNRSYVATFQTQAAATPGLARCVFVQRGRGATVADASGNGNAGAIGAREPGSTHGQVRERALVQRLECAGDGPRFAFARFDDAR